MTSLLHQRALPFIVAPNAGISFPFIPDESTPIFTSTIKCWNRFSRPDCLVSKLNGTFLSFQGVSGLSDQPSAGADGGVEESGQRSGQRSRQRFHTHTVKCAQIFMREPLNKKKSSFAAVSPAEYKKARQEIKKRSSDTLKLQKKAKKGLHSLPCLLISLCSAENSRYGKKMWGKNLFFSFSTTSCSHLVPSQTLRPLQLMYSVSLHADADLSICSLLWKNWNILMIFGVN